jgi:dienelactone hydrolase
MRQDVEFESDGERCAAWLYLPESGKSAPVIVMAHGLGGIRTMRLDAFAERYCAEGYACLVFDYRHFGDSSGQPRQLLSIRRQLEDWKNSVECARRCSGVDGSKVIVWGTSFSGGHVLRTAATVPNIAGVMAQCSFTNGLASSTTLPPLSRLKVAALAFADVLTMPLRKTPVMVDLAGYPGAPALMATQDAVEGTERLKPADSDIPGSVAARVGLAITTYSPGRSASRISCPALVIACLKDTVAPVERTLKYGTQLREGEVVEFDAAHFDIYLGDWFEKTVAIQIDWLKRHFPL